MNNAAPIVNPSHHVHWRCFAGATGVLAIIVAMLVFLGWAIGLPVLTSVLPGAATMKGNTAAGFMLAGLALWLLAPMAALPAWRSRLAASCAGLVCVLGAVTLAQEIFGVDFGIDDLIVQVANPRMAPVTAVAFTLLGLALLLRDARYRNVQILAEVCAIAVALIGLLALVGYAYDVESFYRIYGYSSMALHTALLFALLGLGTLCVRQDRGLMAIVVSEHSGGTVARRILPLAIALPFVLGWLRWQGELLGWYGTGFGLALFAISNILVFTSLVLISAHSVNKMDRQRQFADSALMQSEERLRLALDAAHMGTFDWDIPHNHITGSRWHEELWGFKPGEFDGSYAAFAQRVHPDDMPGINIEIARCIAARVAFAHEFRVVWPDGSIHWIAGRGEFTFGAEGQPQRMRGAVVEISERKLAEEQLRLSETNLAITLNSIGDAVISTDAAGLITHMNPTAERFTGWPLAEALAQPLTAVFRIINALTRLPSTNPVELVMERGEVVGLANHTALLARDGREYQIADSGAPIRNEAGQIVGVVLVFSDVTEKYRVEEALRASETRFRAIVENEPECVKVVGANGKLLEMNAAGLAMLEADSLAEAQAFGLAEFLLPQYRAAFLALHKSVIAGNQGILEFEVTGLRGSRRWLETHAAPLRDADGHISMMLGITRDITTRKQTELALQTSLLEKTALLNEVHHRVKNNLQVITSLLRLEAGRSSQPDTKAVLGDMQGRIRSMALLHETLYRSGTFAEVDLGAYLNQLASQSFRALLTDASSVRLQLDLSSIKVSLDQATPCGLIVTELISNCLKHGFPDGRTGEVIIALQPLDGEKWCLSVSDTGVGLPDNFEARQKNSLGLQLVSSLATQLGGNLVIGPGAVFAVSFTVTAPATIAMEVG